MWSNSIPIIGVTGETGTGKTIFGLSICPGPRTLYIDLDVSGYDVINCINLVKGATAQFPTGWNQKQLFALYEQCCHEIEVGQYDVIFVDNLPSIESGLTDTVADDYVRYGFGSRAKFTSAGGIFWKTVEIVHATLVKELASKCQTLVYSCPTKMEWRGNAPVAGSTVPQGKPILFELSSLFLHLYREQKEGVAPRAKVLKSRSRLQVADGKVDVIPLLPETIDPCTIEHLCDILEG